MQYINHDEGCLFTFPNAEKEAQGPRHTLAECFKWKYD